MAQLPDAFAALPGVFRRHEALAAGVTRHTLSRLVTEGVLTRPTQGVYVVPLPDAPGLAHWQDVRRQHLHRLHEALVVHPYHAGSHVSAAAVHGLPVSLHPAGEVHLTCIDAVPRSRHHPGVRCHHSDSVDNRTVQVGGLRVTDLVRTLADCLRYLKPRNSVPMVDQAIREDRITLAQVRRELDLQKRWVGRPRALAALDLADHRRETWLESFSFVVLADEGVPLPVAQVEVYDDERRFVARVDGMLVEEGVVLEADGLRKYLLAARTEHLSEREVVTRALVAQNTRQRNLEQLGLVCVRWDTDEIRHTAAKVAARVQRARRTNSLDRFTGWLRVEKRWIRP